MSNNIQAAWVAFKLDNGRKSTVNMWCDRGYCPLNFPFYLCTDPCHTRSYCSLGFPVLFSTVCRVVNQLTLRQQRGDYGLRPLYMTRLSQRPSLIHILCRLDHFNMPKKSNTHTRLLPLSILDPWANIEKWKVFSSSWFMPQILIIYCPRKCILSTYIWFGTWYVCCQPLRGGQWVFRVLVQLLVLVMLLMDFLFSLKLHWLRVVP